MTLCKHCGAEIKRRGNERLGRFKARVFCSRKCSDEGRFLIAEKETPGRFWRNVDKRSDEECWLWLGRVNHQRFGYGIFSRHGKNISAHRYSYELHNGKPPANAVVMHSCDVPSCVNPKHLSLGTHAENHADCTMKNRRAAGEAHPHSTLSEQDVVSIILDDRKYVDIAADFKTSASNVCLIKTGKNWKHIERDGQKDMRV